MRTSGHWVGVVDRLNSKWLMHGHSRASDGDCGGWRAASFVFVGQVVPETAEFLEQSLLQPGG